MSSQTDHYNFRKKFQKASWEHSSGSNPEWPVRDALSQDVGVSMFYDEVSLSGEIIMLSRRLQVAQSENVVVEAEKSGGIVGEFKILIPGTPTDQRGTVTDYQLIWQ